MSALTEVFARHIAAPRREVEGAAIRRAAFVPELRAIDEQKRTITFISSTEAVDRYGDVIRASGWQLDTYKKNPVFLWAHRSGDPPVGRTLDVHVETQPKPALVQTVEFADAKTYPFADTIFNLYRGKFLNSVSVGFRPLEQPKRLLDDGGDWTGGYEFTSQELLETSGVPIPANPEAVARAVDAGAVTEAEVARCFLSEEVENKAARAALFASFDRLERSFARLELRLTAKAALEAVRALNAKLDEICGRGKREALPARISTAAEFEAALRGGRN